MPISIKSSFNKALLLCLLLSTQTANAGTKSWRYSIMPYLWNVSFDGNTSSGGNDFPVDVDYSFFTLDNLDNVFSLKFEANNGRIGILLDGLQAGYSDETSNLLFDARLDVDLGYLEAAVSYNPAGFSHIDFIGGIRYIFIDALFYLQPVITPDRTKEEHHTWTDPLVGLRLQDALGKNWFYQLRGDIGGFGVSSDMTINLLGIVGFSFNKNIAAELGYRYVSIDFKENDFLYDVSMYGFVIGLGIHF